MFEIQHMLKSTAPEVTTDFFLRKNDNYVSRFVTRVKIRLYKNIVFKQ